MTLRIPAVLWVALVAVGVAQEPRESSRLAPGPFAVVVKRKDNGKVVPGVYVRLGGRLASSDLEGRAIFDGVPSGTYRLSIEQLGFDRHAQDVTLRPGARADLPIALTPTTIVGIDGRVTLADHGGPLANARVRLTPVAVPSVNDAVYEFPTDWDGKFRVIQIPAGTYRVELSADGCEPKSFEIAVKPSLPPFAWTLARTSKAASLRVTVRDAGTNAVLKNAKVTLAEAWPLGEIAADPARLKVGLLNRMDEKGRLDICRERITVHAAAEGYESGWIPVTLCENGTAEIRLNPTAKLVEKKPNDRLANAFPLPTGAPVELKIEKLKDRSFFKFHLDAPCSVTLELGSKNILETVLSLLAPDGRLLRSQNAWGNSDNRLAVGGLPAGDYYVQVHEWNDDATSAKPMTLRVVTVPAPDPQEPNDDRGTAHFLRNGEEARGCLVPMRDADWFRFHATRPSHVRITIPRHPLERRVILRNAAGAEIASANAWANADLALVAEVKPGDHYVEVREWNDDAESTVPYTIRVEILEDDGVEDVRELPLNGIVANTILPLKDFDRYLVVLPTPGRFHFVGIYPGELTCVLRSATGAELKRENAWANAQLHGTWEAHEPTTLYLDVHEWNDDGCGTSPYVLQIYFEPCDEFELQGTNDTAATATAAEWNEPLRGTFMPIRDVDWYRLHVDHPGVFVLDGRSPTELSVRIRDGRNRVLAQANAWAHAPLALAVSVLPGELFIDAREWNDDASLASPYLLTPRLRRAEPQETVPLADDPIRTLKPGEAQSFSIDQLGDRDRFVFDMTRAGKWTFRLRHAAETTYAIFDDRTGARLQEGNVWANASLDLAMEAKGPTRYRIELREWNNDSVSPAPGRILADPDGRSMPAAGIEVVQDPLDPTLVKFRRTGPKDEKITVDRLEVRDEASHRYASEGLYVALVTVESKDGAKCAIPMWIEAFGPRERKGVRASIDFPGEGQIVDSDRPVRARAMSYTGAKIARASLSIDGRAAGTAYAPPFDFDVRWEPGERMLTLRVEDAKGESATVTRKVKVSEFFGLQPADAAVVTGTEVRVRWNASSFGASRVRYRKAGTPDWKEVRGEDGRTRTVALRDLEPGVPYEFQPMEGGPIRTVTRVKGLAFSSATYGAKIRRDYDQRVGIAVRNHGEKAMTVRLTCGKPESGLLVGFVGEGSEGAPFALGPGEERHFLLGLSAQDVVTANHSFPIHIASDTGLADEATVEVQVQLPVVMLEWEDLGPADGGLAHLYRLVNRGDPVTDLALAGSKPGLILTPSVQHGFLPAGGNLVVRVEPELHSGFQKHENVLVAKTLDREIPLAVSFAVPDGKKLFRVEIVPDEDPAAADKRRQAASLDPSKIEWRDRPQDSDGDGRIDRWERVEGDTLWTGDDTDGDGQVDFVHADVGRDGVVEYSAIRTAQGWDPTNLVEAWLEVGFKLPWARTAYEKHDVDIVMNGVVLGTLRDSIPEGNYSFKIPPAAIRFDEQGRPAGNRIEVKSKHLRGGHYVVSNDYRIRARLTGARQWVVAGSEDEARRELKCALGDVVDSPDFSVSSADLQLDGRLVKGQEIGVTVPLRNIGAARPERVTIALLRALPGEAGVELARTEIEAPPLDGRVLVRLAWRVSSGSHTLKVVVDPDNEYREPDRANNVAMISFTVPGDDAKPKIRLVSPADGTRVEGLVLPLQVEASDDGGIAKVEARIDGGLWTVLPSSEAWILAQPGTHEVRVRATDSSGNQVEAAAKITVGADLPQAEWTRSDVDRRTFHGAAKADRVAIAGARANGGPWIRVKPEGFELPLRFGANRVEMLIADSRGAVRILARDVNCATQPTKDENDELAPEPGFVKIEGVGVADLFAAQNLVIPASIDPELAKLQAEEREIMKTRDAKRVADIRWKIGLRLAGREDLWGAASYIENSVRLDPSHAARWDMLGDLYNFLGRPEAAYLVQDAYEQALKIEPGRTACRAKLAASYLETGRFPKARDEFEKLADGNGEYAGVLGAIYAQTGEVERGIAFFQKQKDPRFTLGIAILKNGIGDRDGALAVLKTVEGDATVGAYAVALRQEWLNPRKPKNGPPPFPVEEPAFENRVYRDDIGAARQKMKKELADITAKHEARIPKEAFQDGRLDPTHPEYTKIKQEWLNEMGQARARHNSTDWRWEEAQSMMENLGIKDKIANTGSKPKGLGSDMDFTPNDYSSGKKLSKAYEGKGYEVVELGDRWVVKGTDTTIWKPTKTEPVGSSSYEASISNKARAHSDAFPTEGGMHSTTGGKIGVEDPAGAVLSNAHKASDAGISKGAQNADMHVVGKSASKAADAGGVKEGNPEFYGKADAARNHMTNEEAGISTFGEKPEVKAREAAKFLEEARSEMRKSYDAAAEKSRALQEQRNSTAEKSYAEGEVAKGNQAKSERIRVELSNRVTLNELALTDPALVKELTGIDATTPKGREQLREMTGESVKSTREMNPARPEVPVGEVGALEAGKKWGGRAMTGLWVLNSGAIGYEEEMEAATREGRDPSKLRMLGNAAWELTMIPAAIGSFQEGTRLRDKYLEEADRMYGNNHWGIQARLLAAGEAIKTITMWNLGTQIANEEILAEEARARAAGVEPDYMRSWGNATLRGLGEVLMINGVCRAMTTDWEAEARWMKQERAVREMAIAKTEERMRELMGIDEKIRRWRERGDRDVWSKAELEHLMKRRENAVKGLHDIAIRMRKRYGSEDPLVQALYDQFAAATGRKRKGRPGYVSVESRQSDWYCTNRPEIQVQVKVPPQITRGKR